jgi:hypothetical protein
MNSLRLFASLACFCALPVVALAGPLDDKSPAYFVDRYGPAKSSQTVSSYDFVHTGRGGVTVKRQFSTREFRKDDLRVQPVYFLPSLKLAAVRLQLNRAWTPEQIEAALAAYGGEWKLVKRGPTITSWVAPDGTLAISMLTWIDFQSKAIVDLTAKTVGEADAKQKGVPQF